MSTFTKKELPTRRRGEAGFTLIELMITLVVVAVLAAIALPAYQDSIRKGRRSDALQALSAAQLAQERWRSNHAEYTPNLSDLQVISPTSGGYYTLSLAAVSSAPGTWRTGYRVLATAVGSQAGDTNCKLLGVEVNGGIVRNGAGESAINWSLAEPDPNRCWAQ